jgi:uncharacterized membrane protein YjfL (UPF0719 family)
MNVIRRIRAMLSTAVVWGAAWSVVGLVWVGVSAFLSRNSALEVGIGGFVWTVVLNWTLIGAIGGALFGLILSLAERRRSSLSALSMRRVVTWGAIGSAALPLLVIPLVPIVAPDFARELPAIHKLAAAIRQAILAGTTYGLLGAISAGATLRLARGADRDLLSASGGLSAVQPGHPVNADADKEAHSAIRSN